MAYSKHWRCVWTNISFQKFTIISNYGIKLIKICSPLDFYLPTRVQFALSLLHRLHIISKMIGYLWLYFVYLLVQLCEFCFELIFGLGTLSRSLLQCNNLQWIHFDVWIKHHNDYLSRHGLLILVNANHVLSLKLKGVKRGSRPITRSI